MKISNEPAVSVLGVTAERDGWGQLILVVGDIHTAESFPDSLRHKEQRADLPSHARAITPPALLPPGEGGSQYLVR